MNKILPRKEGLSRNVEVQVFCSETNNYYYCEFNPDPIEETAYITEVCKCEYMTSDCGYAENYPILED